MGFFGGSGGGTTNAGDITSGTLALARGGSGADLSATGGTGEYLKQASAGANVTVGTIAAGDLPSAIDAAKIADGSVSNTEFQYLNGVTSAIQTQINGISGLDRIADITDGVEIYNTSDVADKVLITVDSDGDATINPTGTQIILDPSGGASTKRVYVVGTSHYFGNASSWLGLYAPSGGQQFFVGGTSILYTASTGVHMSTGKLVHRATVAGITASTTQSQGQGALAGEINEISTCATANDTVTLSQAAAGKVQVVINNGAETAQVFPASGDAIDGGSVNASTTVAAGETAIFFAYDSTNWVKK